MRLSVLMLFFALIIVIPGCKAEKINAIKLSKGESYSIVSEPNILIIVGALDDNSTSILVLRENRNIMNIDIQPEIVKTNSTKYIDEMRIDTVDHYNSDGVPEKRVSSKNGIREKYEIFIDGKFTEINYRDKKYYLNGEQVELVNGHWHKVTK